MKLTTNYRPMNGRAFLLALVIGAYAAAPLPAQSIQPAGWNADLKLAEASDKNPDPKIVEIDLQARVESLEIVPGVHTKVWTYNGGSARSADSSSARRSPDRALFQSASTADDRSLARRAGAD